MNKISDSMLKLQNMKLQIQNANEQIGLFINSMQNCFNQNYLQIYNFGFQLINLGLQALNLGYELNGENSLDISNNLDSIHLEFEKIKNKIQNNGNLNSFGEMKNYQKKKYDLTIFFSHSWGTQSNIQCYYDDKISDIIKTYRIKSGDNDENENFFYNGKKLNLESTVKKSYIKDYSTIYVVPFGSLK